MILLGPVFLLLEPPNSLGKISREPFSPPWPGPSHAAELTLALRSPWGAWLAQVLGQTALSSGKAGGG